MLGGVGRGRELRTRAWIERGLLLCLVGWFLVFLVVVVKGVWIEGLKTSMERWIGLQTRPAECSWVGKKKSENKMKKKAQRRARLASGKGASIASSTAGRIAPPLTASNKFPGEFLVRHPIGD